MKYALFILFALPLLADDLKLTWDYPEEEKADIDVWKLYHTSSLEEPIAWSLYGTYPVDLTTNLITVDIQPGREFFYLTASNYWGESMPSNTARSKFNPVVIDTLKAKH